MRVEKGHHIGKQRSPRILVPGYGEAQEINKGVKKEGKLSKLAKSKLIRTAVVLAGVSSGIQIAHSGNSDIPSVPALYQDAKQGIESLLPDNGPPSRGDFFNPKRDSGEISSLNTVPLPIDKQVALINAETNKDGSVYFILPNPGKDIIHYEKTWSQYYPIVLLRNLPTGSVFVSPYNGSARYEKYYEQGMLQGMKLEITFQVRQSDGKLIDKYINYGIVDGKLLLPNSNDNPLINGTFTSSELPVKAGQPMFEIVSGKLENSAYGTMQVLVGNPGGIFSKNNKAIVAP